MNKVRRVRAVLAGEKPDHAPVSFWHHFAPGMEAGEKAVQAHLAHLEKYDLDFLKVMNDNDYPRPACGVISSVGDLAGIEQLSGDEAPFAKQLEVIKRLRQEIGEEVMMATTVFSPWSVLRRLTAPAPVRHGPPVLEVGEDARDRMLRELLSDDASAMQEALLRIAATLCDFSRFCIQAGADGVFFSVREDWVEAAGDETTYEKIVRPADRLVFSGISSGTFNMLHICGNSRDFDSFCAYPFQVVNWADRTAGPSIASVKARIKPAICCGVDNLHTLVHGTPDDCAREVKEALSEAAGRPIMISAGCTYDPEKVPQANLKAVCRAACEAK